jgi:hypothetical protein
LNFAGAAGSGGETELWAYDGTAWRRVNPVDAYASNAEILAGSVANKQISPAGLQSRTRATSAGAADAGYIPRLNASGLIDSSMLAIAGGLRFIGATDLAVAFALTPSGGLQGGDYVVHNGAGAATVHASYTGAAGQLVDAGDMVLYDGSDWTILQTGVDLSSYLSKAGGSMIAGAAITFDVPGGAGLVDRLNGTDAAKSSISNFTLDAGVL